MELSVSTQGWKEEAGEGCGRAESRSRDRLEGAMPPERALSGAEQEGQACHRCRHRGRTGAGGLHLGNQSRDHHGPFCGEIRRDFQGSKAPLAATPVPGRPRRATVRRRSNLVQRRGRSHGRGIPDCAVRPIARSTPVRRQGKPQTNIRICGQIRGSEHDHRRLKASLPPLHDHRAYNLPRQFVERLGLLRRRA